MCPTCGAGRLGDARFCVECGTPFVVPSTATPSTATPPTATPAVPNRSGSCRGCDLAVAPQWPYCPRCGAAAPATTRGRRTTATTATADGRAEGWYPDPFGRSVTRWWDGATWTAYVSDTAVHWDPVSFATEPQPGVRGIGVALIGFAVGIAIGFPTTYAMHETGEPGGRAALILVSALSLWLGLGAALGYVTYVRGSRSLVTDYGLRFRWVDLPLGVAGWIAGRILGAIMVLPVFAIWPDLRPTGDGIYGDDTISTATWIVLALIVCIGAPFVEELFFRGLVQTRLVDRFGAVVGILVTSVMFGAAHLIGWVGPVTFVYAIAITGAGIVLGLLRYLTGRLGPSILTHVLFNTQALVVVALLR